MPPAAPLLSPAGRATRRRRLAGVVAALALTVAASACVGGPKTPRADEVTPLPDGMEVVSDTEVPCRDGEAGFAYRFLVVRPDDLGADGALRRHLRDRGFYATIVDTETYDLPWATVGYNIDSIKVRLTGGPLEAYLEDPKPFTGPPVDQLPAEVRAHPQDYALLALRPYDFGCDTPL